MLKSDLLKNKTALITGCNRGIGKVILETFAHHGASIWACARMKSPEFEEFLQNTRSKYNVVINPLYFDLGNESDIKDALKNVLVTREKIDILVNNAGIAYGGLFQMTTINKIKEVFNINFYSHIIVTQYIVKNMLRHGGGSIINMASVVGVDPDAGYLAYGSSKAALINATKVMAKELAMNNIRVNSIAPGLTDTDMASLMERKSKESLIRSSAMNRMAYPQEIANAALFLASDLSSFVTGQVLKVDGCI